MKLPAEKQPGKHSWHLGMSNVSSLTNKVKIQTPSKISVFLQLLFNLVSAISMKWMRFFLIVSLLSVIACYDTGGHHFIILTGYLHRHSFLHFIFFSQS